MSTVSEVLKDYGPAIGPALAFFLGVLAVLAKYKLDQLTARWTLAKRIENLQMLVAQAAPPKDFFPMTSDAGFIHADEARNLTNLARFYSRLLALRPVFDAVGKAVSEHGNASQALQFYHAKWWFDILIAKVEKWRAEEDFRPNSLQFSDLNREWTEFSESISGKTNMQYIERIKRTQSVGSENSEA